MGKTNKERIFVIIKPDGKRVPLSPAFEYPKQAEKYIDNKLGGSPYLKIHRVKIK